MIIFTRPFSPQAVSTYIQHSCSFRTMIHLPEASCCRYVYPIPHFSSVCVITTDARCYHSSCFYTHTYVRCYVYFLLPFLYSERYICSPVPPGHDAATFHSRWHPEKAIRTFCSHRAVIPMCWYSATSCLSNWQWGHWAALFGVTVGACCIGRRSSAWICLKTS